MDNTRKAFENEEALEMAKRFTQGAIEKGACKINWHSDYENSPFYRDCANVDPKSDMITIAHIKEVILKEHNRKLSESVKTGIPKDAALVCAVRAENGWAVHYGVRQFPVTLEEAEIINKSIKQISGAS